MQPDQVCLTSYRIYETAIRYYIVGATQDEQRYAILKVDRTVDEAAFQIEEDETLYSKKQINELLAAIDDGNRACGGLRRLVSACGIIGMIRFTSNYYLWLITKRSIVAQLGGHYIYHIEDTKLLSLTHSGSTHSTTRSADEARYQGILGTLEINKTFYFSNTYDITHTLQYNLTTPPPTHDRFLGRFQEMFVWNHFLLDNAFGRIQGHVRWCVPIVHGFIDQAKITVLGRTVYLTIIARRSRHFAGARFLKRGANQDGHVANDVETEQIVADGAITSFRRADGRLNKAFTSFVQHRGSIPLHWSQTVDGVNPKPPIELNVVDPHFRAAALHFDDMFERYGTPIFVVNLIKARERTPRETILGKEFTESIAYLNQSLPPEHKLRYSAWDMSRASKSPDQEVISTLEKIAKDTITATGFFRTDPEIVHLQSGVARTNCIDCLDRTNAAQFVIGKQALALQLYSLGIIAGPSDLMYDCDCVSMLIEMYHDHGDTIAMQYGGSHLVNTMETYRKINQWSSHSRDMLESIRRFYNNSFLDAQRQDAINLFLGFYDTSTAHATLPDGKVLNLWDLENDERLHHNLSPPLEPHVHYRKWYRQKVLQECGRHQLDAIVLRSQSDRLAMSDRRYWDEYYKPNVLSTVNKIFAYGMNSTALFSRHSTTHVDTGASEDRLVEFDIDPSPFTVRVNSASNEEQVARNALDSCGGTQAATDSPGRALQAANQAMRSSLSLVSRDASVDSTDSKSVVSRTRRGHGSRHDMSLIGRDILDTPQPDRKISIHRWLGNVTGRHVSHEQSRRVSINDRQSSVTLTPQQSARIASYASQLRTPLAQRVDEVQFTTEPLASARSYRRHVSSGKLDNSPFIVPKRETGPGSTDRTVEDEMSEFVAKLLSPVPMSTSTTSIFLSSLASTAPTTFDGSDIEEDIMRDLATYTRFVEMAPRVSNLPPPMSGLASTTSSARPSGKSAASHAKPKPTRSESSGMFRLSNAARQFWRGRQAAHDTVDDKKSRPMSPTKSSSSKIKPASESSTSSTPPSAVSAAKKWRRRARTLTSAKRRSKYQNSGPENGTIEEVAEEIDEEDERFSSPNLVRRSSPPSPISTRWSSSTTTPRPDRQHQYDSTTATVTPGFDSSFTRSSIHSISATGGGDSTTATYANLIAGLMSFDVSTNQTTPHNVLQRAEGGKDDAMLLTSVNSTLVTNTDTNTTAATMMGMMQAGNETGDGHVGVDDLRIYQDAAALAA